MHRQILATAFSVFAIVGSSQAQTLDLDVYALGQSPKDTRLGKLKDLNGYFPFEVPATKQAWIDRAQKVRQRILVSCGLWPMPDRPPVNATIHGLVDRSDYTVEKVYFESYPGLYVTGSLYRPKGKTGPSPVVLSPHGHFADGRFYECGEKEVKEQLFTGAERWEVAARFPLQARCVQLARMGCVVFHYDMVGYADSKPITYERAHRHAKPRPQLENTSAWGLYTAPAEMRLQNTFGLQTFNSLRAVDFVAALPDVDPNRIAVTGASGGGTQTMILAAIEPRVAVSFPAVMVSTAMQGGCTCENATCLRVGTGNVEFAALFCPKPQGINAANDWTVDLATKGLPELKRLYKLFGASQNIEGYPLVHFPHNFNHVSRGKMYAWINKHFDLGFDKYVLEKDFDPLSILELSVWNQDHPAPPSDLAAEQKLLKAIAKSSDDQLMASSKNPEDHKTLVRSAMETITASSWDEIGEIDRQNIAKVDMGEYWLFKDILREAGCELPVVFLYPKQWKKDVVIWSADEGKRGLRDAAGELRAEVVELLDAGFAIAAADLFQQGEFIHGKSLTQTRKVDNNRDFAGYTFGYNPTLIAHRVHDLLVLLKFISNDEHAAKQTWLLAVEGATPYGTLAATLAGQHLDKLVIDDDDFRFANVKSWRDPNFLPGAIKYGDLTELLSSTRVRIAEDLSTAVRHIRSQQQATAK